MAYCIDSIDANIKYQNIRQYLQLIVFTQRCGTNDQEVKCN